MTVLAVTLLAVLLLCALLAAGLLAMLWRAAVNDLHQVEDLLRAKCAELDALSLAPPAAVAALTPDDPSLLPAEVEQYLRTLNGDTK